MLSLWFEFNMSKHSVVRLKAGLASLLLAYPALHYGHPITRNIGAWWGPRRFVPGYFQASLRDFD